MKIGFYNPYFDVPSGGERYTLTLAEHWSKRHTVSLFWDDPNVVGLSEKRFGLDLSRVSVVPNVFAHANIFVKLWETKKYDVIFFLSDGSIPTTLARHNILHFQVPFPNVLTDPLKMMRYDIIVANSQFTKRELDPNVGERAVVIYPPVQSVPRQPSLTRRKQILSVGRFTGYFDAKKQEVLIAAFAKGYESGAFSGWELVLAGPLIPSDEAYFSRLKQQIGSLPITLLPNISNAQLMALYRQSPLYWHAAGFGETDPRRMEHFGITTVEAMSAGAVPLVYAAGGQLEIVTDSVNGMLWKTQEELIRKTTELIADRNARRNMAKEAQMRAEDFSKDRFSRAYDALIEGWR